MSIIQRLHDSEINCSVSTFYDGCFTVKLGDEMNGFKAEAVVSNWNEAEAWLDAMARLHYPKSDYAVPALASPGVKQAEATAGEMHAHGVEYARTGVQGVAPPQLPAVRAI